MATPLKKNGSFSSHFINLLLPSKIPQLTYGGNFGYQSSSTRFLDKFANPRRHGLQLQFREVLPCHRGEWVRTNVILKSKKPDALSLHMSQGEEKRQMNILHGYLAKGV